MPIFRLLLLLALLSLSTGSFAQAESVLRDAGDVPLLLAVIAGHINLVGTRPRPLEAGDTIMIDTDGAAVGQINGLAVLGLGNFAFGKASRITATVRMGRGEVVDIEREVALSGPLHAKGVLILSGYLGRTFAQNYPLNSAISITFEQSYSGVDGDSASST